MNAHPDHNADVPGGAVAYRDIDAAADLLDPLHAEVLRLRLGRTGVPPLSLTETAERLGCSPEDVRHREAEGIAALRRHAASVREQPGGATAEHG